MPQEIRSTSKPKSLAKLLARRVLTEALSKLKVIDDNKNMVAECETLTERLKASGLQRGICASVDVFDDSIRAFVLIQGQPMSAIRDAIKSAGLHIYSECPIVFLGGTAIRPITIHSIRIELTGLDCAIVVRNIVEEFAEAA